MKTPNIQRRQNNRQERRAAKKDALAACQERVAELERENATLRQFCKAQLDIIESHKQHGTITVIEADNLPDELHTYTTLEAAQGMAKETFFQGIEYAQNMQRLFFVAVGDVWRFVEALQRLCFANGGSDTTQALIDTSAALVAALDTLDSTLRQLDNVPGIGIDRAPMGPMLDICQRYRDHAKRYIGSSAKDRPAAQAEFRSFVLSMNPDLQPLYYAVSQTPRSGRDLEPGTRTLLDLGARLYRRHKDCTDYASTERIIVLELQRKAQRTADEDAALARLKYASVPGLILKQLMNRHGDRKSISVYE